MGTREIMGSMLVLYIFSSTRGTQSTSAGLTSAKAFMSTRGEGVLPSITTCTPSASAVSMSKAQP